MNIEIECSEEKKIKQITQAEYECKLWQSFKSGDKTAFGQIFKLYYKPLSIYGRNIYPDYDFINDCIQEMFLEFWQYRQTIGDVNSVKFYIIKCFKRKVIRNLENIKKKETKTLKNNYDKIFTNSFESDLVMEQSEQQKKLKVANEIKGLSKRQQEAVHLKFFEDLSYDEICSIMSLNYQSVKNLIHNSMKTLREKLVLNNILALVITATTFMESSI
jgi:RNA polymerase sigma factor (sigma-70 family)